MADVQPIQAEAERKKKAPVPKSRRCGQGKLCLPPLHGTPGGAVEQPTPDARTHEGTCMQGQCQGTECQHLCCLGQGRRRNTDLRSSCIITCTSALRRRVSRQRQRVRIIASISASRGRLCRLERKTARSEEAPSRNCIRGRTGLGQDKTG